MVKDFVSEPSFDLKWEMRYDNPAGNVDNCWMENPRIRMKIKKDSSSDAPILTTSYVNGSDKGIMFIFDQRKPGFSIQADFRLINSSFQMTTVAYDYEYNGNKYLIAQNQGSTIRLTLNTDAWKTGGVYTMFIIKGSYVEIPSGCLICCLMPTNTASEYEQNVDFGVENNTALPRYNGGGASEAGIIHTYDGKINWDVDGVGSQWLKEHPPSKISLADITETPRLNLSSSVHDYIDLFGVNVSDNILTINKDASFVIPNDVDTTTNPPTLSTQTVTISQLFQLINSLVDRLHALEVACANVTTDVLINAAPDSEAYRLAQIKEEHKTV